MMNPYSFSRKVFGKQFYGRENILNVLYERIINSVTPNSCSLVGETRIGKSSILAEFIERYKRELSNRFSVVLFDMSSDFCPGETKEFYQQFLALVWEELLRQKVKVERELAQEVEKAISANGQWAIIMRKIFKCFEGFQQKNINLLIILDEFDYTTELFKVDPQGFRILRSIGYEPKYGVTYLTASRKTISQIEKDAGISSNLAGIFGLGPSWVSLMDDKDAENLIKQPAKNLGVFWDPEETEQIIKLSGKHPYLIQYIASNLFATKVKHDKVSDSEIRKIAKAGVAELLDALIIRLEKSQLYKSLQKFVSNKSEPFPRNDIELLKNLGYLISDDMDQYQLFSPMFSEYLEKSKSIHIPLPQDPLAHYADLKGWKLAKYNIIMEGDTDCLYLQLANEHNKQRNGIDLLEGISLIPVGKGREGGATNVARSIITLKELAKTNPVLAVLDNDQMGRLVAEALDRLGLQRKKDFILLDRKYFPLKNYQGNPDVEIEDLLSEAILRKFHQAMPEACEQVIDRGKDGCKFSWRGEAKDKMVEYIQQNATETDTALLCELLKQIRAKFKLPVKETTLSTRNLKNPYIIGSPVTGKNFFGRKQAVESIIHNISDNDYLIDAQWRTGKTSLLLKIQDELLVSKLKKPILIPIYIDLMGQPEDNLWRKMAVAMLAACKRKFNLETENIPVRLTDESLEYGWNDLKNDLYQLLNQLPNDIPETAPDGELPGIKFIFLIDEVQQTNSYTGTTRADLRKFLSQDPLIKPYISSILAGYNIERLAGENQSPWTNFTQILDLDDFSEVDMRMLINNPLKSVSQGKIKYEHAAVEKIMLYGKGIPYDTQLYCHLAFEKMRQMGEYIITETIIEAIHQQASRQITEATNGVRN